MPLAKLEKPEQLTFRDAFEAGHAFGLARGRDRLDYVFPICACLVLLGIYDRFGLTPAAIVGGLGVAALNVIERISNRKRGQR